MLSFTNGRPIAYIEGGKYNGKTLHINNDDTRISKNEKNRGYEISLSNGKMVPVPNDETRDTAYVAGPSGSGKSTYIGSYAEQFQDLFPDSPVYVFSRKPEDPALDFLDPTRILVDEELVEDPIDAISELANSLVIFDDTDTIQDNDIKKAVSKLKNDILETGRAYDIYTIISSHLINPNERKDSRTILNECSSLTIFPKSGSTYQIEYTLKRYFGMSPTQIKIILSLPSRWVTIFKNYPQVVLYETGAYLLNK